MAAKNIINDYSLPVAEEIELATKYSVITTNTAFLAIEKKVIPATGATIEAVVPTIRSRDYLVPSHTQMQQASVPLFSPSPLSNYVPRYPTASASALTSALPKGKSQVVIKTMGGKTQCIDFDPHDTIGMFKKKIFEQTGLPVKQQRLICQGMILKDDNKTFEDYGITDASSIFLIITLGDEC